MRAVVSEEERSMSEIQPLIRCGGGVTRLWPSSRESLPKQFVILLGLRSSFQETVLRRRGPGFAERPLVIRSGSHRNLVDQQLAEIGIQADILLEPARRDSRPAILAARMKPVIGCPKSGENRYRRHGG